MLISVWVWYEMLLMAPCPDFRWKWEKQKQRLIILGETTSSPTKHIACIIRTILHTVLYMPLYSSKKQKQLQIIFGETTSSLIPYTCSVQLLGFITILYFTWPCTVVSNIHVTTLNNPKLQVQPNRTEHYCTSQALVQ